MCLKAFRWQKSERAALLSLLDCGLLARPTSSCIELLQDFLKQLFEDAGFVTESLSCQSRLVENRKKGLKMDRLFVQGVFRLDTHNSRETSALSIPAQVPDQPSSIQCKLRREECWGLEWLLPMEDQQERAATMALAAAVSSQLDASLAQTRVLEWGSLPGSGLAAMLALKSCRSDKDRCSR